jgi:protein-tyrosine-phosphatase
MTGKLPHAILFACTQNVIRSPMAAAIMRHLYGKKVYVASIGIKPEADPFVAAVLAEIGIDIGKHHPHTFADLEDSNFDLAVALSPEAQHWTNQLTRTMALDTEYWPTMDPSVTTGSREQIMDAYRGVRDALIGRIEQRFGTAKT